MSGVRVNRSIQRQHTVDISRRQRELDKNVYLIVVERAASSDLLNIRAALHFILSVLLAEPFIPTSKQKE